MKIIKISGDRYMIEGSQMIYSEKEIKHLRAVEDVKSDNCVKALYEGELNDESRSEPIKVEVKDIKETTNNVKPYTSRRHKWYLLLRQYTIG